MMRMIHLYEDIINPGDIAFLAESLRSGKILVFPTDTVPGLLADASNSSSVEKIFEIKKRPKEKKLPVFVASIEMAKNLAQISEENEKEMALNWPGAFTYILNRKPSTDKLYGIEDATIALRVPKYKPLNDLLEKVGIPLVQTSVNASGTPPLTNTEKIFDYFKDADVQPDIIVNTGKIDFGNPSQITDLTFSEKKIIRS